MQGLTKKLFFLKMHQKTDSVGEWFMIYVRLLASRKNLVYDNRKAQCDAKVCQTPHVFSDLPGRCKLEKECCLNCVYMKDLLRKMSSVMNLTSTTLLGDNVKIPSRNFVLPTD